MTIKTRNIANGAVTDAKMAANTITNASIAAATILDSNIAAIAAAAGNLGTTLIPRIATALYSFAVDGGAQGAITPATNTTIPAGAIVYASVLHATTAVTSAGAATLSAGTVAGSGAASVAAATAKASLSDDAVVQGIDYNTTKPFVMTAAGKINVTVGTADLTAGVVEIFVVYTMGAEGAS